MAHVCPFSTTYSTPAEVIKAILQTYETNDPLASAAGRAGFDWEPISAFGPYIAVLHWHKIYCVRLAQYQLKLGEITEVRVVGWKAYRDSVQRYDVFALLEYVQLPDLKQKRRLQHIVIFDIVLQNHREQETSSLRLQC